MSRRLKPTYPKLRDISIGLEAPALLCEGRGYGSDQYDVSISVGRGYDRCYRVEAGCYTIFLSEDRMRVLQRLLAEARRLP